MSLLASIRPAATTETVLYTVPPSQKGIVNVLITNNAGSNLETLVRFGIQSSVAAFSDVDYVIYDLQLENNDFWEMTGIALTAGQSLRVYTTVNTINFKCFGLLETL